MIWVQAKKFENHSSSLVCQNLLLDFFFFTRYIFYIPIYPVTCCQSWIHSLNVFKLSCGQGPPPDERCAGKCLTTGSEGGDLMCSFSQFLWCKYTAKARFKRLWWYYWSWSEEMCVIALQSGCEPAPTPYREVPIILWVLVQIYLGGDLDGVSTQNWSHYLQAIGWIIEHFWSLRWLKYSVEILSLRLLKIFKISFLPFLGRHTHSWFKPTPMFGAFPMHALSKWLVWWRVSPKTT